MHTAPLFPAAVGMILGIVLDRAHPFTLSVFVLAFIGTGIAAIPRIVRDVIGPVLVLIAAMCLGGALHSTTTRVTAASSVERYVNQTKEIARVSGVISSKPRVLTGSSNPFERWTYQTDRTAFLLNVESIEGLKGNIPVTGRLRVTIHEVVLDLRENERVEVFGWLYRFKPPQNPGAFDWASYYRHQGIAAGLSCNLRENIRRLDVVPPPRHPRGMTRLRTIVRAMLTDDLASGSDEEASLLEAMVLGHRSRLDRRLNEVFIRAGCAHFLAVSGTHVVVVMSLVWAAGRLIGAPRRRCVWLVAVAVVAYAAIAEPRPPILRATVMAVLFCGSLLLRRSRARLNWMSAAAVILVSLNTTNVFDVGFQLSFAAVLGVSYLTPALFEFVAASRRVVERVTGVYSRWQMDRELADIPAPREGGQPSWARSLGGTVRRVNRVILLLLAVSAGAWLAGAPIVAWHFHRIQPLGPVASVIVYPLMSLVMALGFAKIIAGLILPPLGALIGGPLATVDAFMIASAETLGSLPGASMWVSAPPWWWIPGYYGFLLLFARRFRRPMTAEAGRNDHPKDKPPSRPPWETTACAAAALVFAGTSLVWAWPKAAGDRLVMTVLAVGAGSATVIELPNGQTILYDAGSRSPVHVGRNIVVPFLRHRGIGRIDQVYLSHPNLDHFSGLPAIIDLVDTGPIIINEHFASISTPRSPGRHLLDIHLSKHDREIQTLDPSQASWSAGGVGFEQLWPVGGVDHTLSSNDSSMVLRLTYAGRSILLPGDVEEHAQRALLDRGNLQADVLVLPHHGGVTASTAAFLAAVEPTVMICSGHQPLNESISPLPAIVGNIPLHNTAEVGAVEIIIDQAGLHVAAPGLR